MKTSDKDIENMAREDAVNYSDEDCDPFDDRVESYINGYKDCEAKMLAESAESFADWYHSTYGEDFPNASIEYFDYGLDCFTAGAMSQAKKDAEELEALTLDNVEKIFTGLGKNLFDFCDYVKKQGGER
jgi:hypothetical protein